MKDNSKPKDAKMIEEIISEPARPPLSEFEMKLFEKK